MGNNNIFECAELVIKVSDLSSPWKRWYLFKWQRVNVSFAAITNHSVKRSNEYIGIKFSPYKFKYTHDIQKLRFSKKWEMRIYCKEFHCHNVQVTIPNAHQEILRTQGIINALCPFFISLGSEKKDLEWQKLDESLSISNKTSKYGGINHQILLPGTALDCIEIIITHDDVTKLSEASSGRAQNHKNEIK